MIRSIANGVVALMVVCATGCSSGHDFADLDAFMAEKDAQRPRPIDPLPEFSPYEPFVYSAANLRSPFEPPQEIKPVDRSRSRPNVTPDFNRTKQYLEQFNMAELMMVGTLSQGASLFGLVRDSSGGVHRVQNGDYMGTDHGRIHVIGEARIELIEIVPDGAGGWVERERTVALGGVES